MKVAKLDGKDKLKVQDLILLGLLRESPKHGYELKHIVNERMQHIASITSGTVYYTLKKLERKGYINRKREREGERPERNVFSLTKDGEEYFYKLLRKCLFIKERNLSSFDIALYFMPYIDFSLIIEAIKFKLKELEDIKGIINNFEKNYPDRWPFHLHSIKEKTLLQVETMEKWYRNFMDKIEEKIRRKSGRYG